jgi:hypothetical protein
LNLPAIDVNKQVKERPLLELKNLPFSTFYFLFFSQNDDALNADGSGVCLTKTVQRIKK